MHELADQPNVNLVTCGGQATIPIVAAIARVAPVPMPRSSPASRANRRDREPARTSTSSRRRPRAGIERVGGARKGKAIIVLNPAEPPLIMRNTVFCLVEGGDAAAIERSVEQMAADVRAYVPGYRLKQAVQFEDVSAAHPARVDGAVVHARPESVGVPRNRRRRALPAEVRRQPRHHDVGRAPHRRAAGGIAHALGAA